MFSTLIDKWQTWQHSSAILDVARDTQERYNELEKRYARLKAATKNLTAQKRVPSGWSGLMNEIRKLDQLLYELDGPPCPHEN